MAALLNLSPKTGVVGDTIKATLTGFGYRWWATIKLDGVQVASVQVDKTGAATTTFQIPAGTAKGFRLVRASTRYRWDTETLEVKDPVVVVPPPVDPPPVDPPPTGIPPIGPKPANSLLHKDFADGLLFPFVGQVYPNAHPYVPGNDQYMSQYCRYVTDAAHISVHDGYLDLRCTKASPFWLAAFVATFEAPGAWPPKPTFNWQYGLSEVCISIESGVASSQNAAWPGTWGLDPGSSEEPDWIERITGRDTANVRPGPTQPVSLPAMDTNWHIVGMKREPTRLTFYLDGKEVGHRDQALTKFESLLADSKVGLTDPNTGATPALVRMRVAWWRVKPL